MSKRSQLLYLQDILESIEAIESYVESIHFEEFIEDRKTYSATIREFEIIGEAVGNILDSPLLDRYTHIPWREIKGFGNLLIHEYFGVDAEVIWRTIDKDLPELKESIEKMIHEEKNR
jgi:uncharacterized protein with HEPN domain